MALLGGRGLLLADARTNLRALARACIRARALSMDGQIHAMALAAITVDVDQALDVEAELGAQLALDLVFVLDDAAQLDALLFEQALDARLRADARLLADGFRRVRADAVDVRQRDDDALLIRNI